MRNVIFNKANSEATPLKINKKVIADQRDIDNALNLNHPVVVRPLGNSKRSRAWMFMTAAFFLIACGLAAKVFFFKASALGRFDDLIPPQAISFSLIKVPSILQGESGLQALFAKNQTFGWWQDQITQFLYQEEISFQDDLAPVLKDEAAFFILPFKNNQIVWLALVQKEDNRGLVTQGVFSRLESGLKKRFGASQQIYRQVEINLVFSLRETNRIYYWSQINDLIVIGNNLEAMKKIIDQDIDRNRFFK